MGSLMEGLLAAPGRGGVGTMVAQVQALAMSGNQDWGDLDHLEMDGMVLLKGGLLVVAE